MRTIKFRGRSLVNGKWSKGSLTLDYDKKPCIRVAGYSDAGIGFDVTTAVDPATVGQFTGLLDRNGREIYELDELQREGYPPAVMMFHQGAWCLVWFDENMEIDQVLDAYIEMYTDGKCQYEVVGAVGDNS